MHGARDVGEQRTEPAVRRVVMLEMLRGLWRRVDGTLITQPAAQILSMVEEADVAGWP